MSNLTTTASTAPKPYIAQLYTYKLADGSTFTTNCKDAFQRFLNQLATER